MALSALAVVAAGLWMLVDPRLLLWIESRNERFSRRIYRLLGAAPPPDAMYSLSRAIVRWAVPITTIVAGLAVLVVAVR